MTALLIVMAMALSACFAAADVVPLIESHVLFATTAAMLWGLGKMATALAPEASASGFWALFRRTLPWHPVLTGAWLGLAFPHLVPESVGVGRVAAALYFGASGVLATYGHDVFRTWVKYRNQS
jgi:hypothetical protein